MTTYALILTFLFYNSIAVVTLTGFSTSSDCTLAGERVQQIKEPGLKIRYQCVENTEMRK